MLASQFYHKRIFVKKGLKQGLHPDVTITVGMYTDRLLLVKSLISFFLYSRVFNTISRTSDSSLAISLCSCKRYNASPLSLKPFFVLTEEIL